MPTIEIGKTYEVKPTKALWNLANVRSEEITVSALASALVKGTIVNVAAATSSGSTTTATAPSMTAASTALSGRVMIVAEDAAKSATAVRVLVSGEVYLDAINDVSGTSFTKDDFALADTGNVIVLDREVVTYGD